MKSSQPGAFLFAVYHGNDKFYQLFASDINQIFKRT